MRQSQQRGHFQSIACRVVGLSRQTVSEPFFASPAGALRPSGPSWRRRPSLSREAPPARPTMRFTSEDASHAAWLVAEQLLQGCPKIFPSVDITFGVHSQHPWPLRTSRERDTALLGAFGVGLPSPPHVPSSWFCTTSTACSTDGSQACCILLPTLGFIGFPRFAVCRLASRASPPMLHPPELIHLQSRFPVTRDRYLLAVPGLRPLFVGHLSTSRSCSVQASVAWDLRCRMITPVTLMGFPLLKRHAQRSTMPCALHDDHPKRSPTLSRPCRCCLPFSATNLSCLPLRCSSTSPLTGAAPVALAGDLVHRPLRINWTSNIAGSGSWPASVTSCLILAPSVPSQGLRPQSSQGHRPLCSTHSRGEDDSSL